MNIQRLSAFSDGASGGNPAGVLISDSLPSEAEMQSIAAQVGYSETAFAAPIEDGWRVRYFSPESEVAFCGHATIALGAALAKEQGQDVYPLILNEAKITVEGFVENDLYSAALQSPETTSQSTDESMLSEALNIFGYSTEDLNQSIPPARANGGAEHLIITLKSRALLSAMKYDLDEGRTFMRKFDLVTIMLVYCENEQLFHTRNPFASGGVYEDPATGAASAAFAGYLRDIRWPHSGEINIVQGEDMGSRSLINAKFSDIPGSSIRISGAVRFIE
ncbi:PhzF family phenazine biosynthesis protein [Aliikangiella marina]|uniref:PhzF family phenazine biosynthesis protein n=1 Tax=Aliikangiella marina TaxID=1712262 RepID=A0A545TC53_9GAMM|nr:PhzF family phenazine biosynthesis protein [Aliikangiella marina]TQV74797.1 PhzF family phenazine biosynthesis protein [Aliikangiella marina]